MKTKREITRLVIGLTISTVLVVAAFRYLNFWNIWDIIRSAKPAILFAAAGLLFCGYFMRSVRWWLMLRGGSERPPSVGITGAVLLAGFAANNVLPFRAGDILRATYFSRRLRTSPSFLFGTLVLERALDLLSLLTLCVVILPYTRLDAIYPEILKVTIGAAICGVAGLSMLLLFGAQVQGLLQRLLLKIIGEGPRARKVNESIEQLLKPFCNMSLSMAAQLSVLSIAVWSFEGLMYLAVAKALGIGLGMLVDLSAMVMANFVTMIPSAPGYVGTFHAAVIAVLKIAGASNDKAAAFAVCAHAMLWLPITIAGGIAFLVIREPKQTSVLPQEAGTQ